MSLGGRPSKRGKRTDRNRVNHTSARCPLRPENWARHTLLDRKVLLCTCEWDAAHGR